MTTTASFLSVPEMCDMHLYQLEHFGGMSGTRAPNLLTSAIAMPEMSFGGELLHRDLFEMAAAYLFHLVQNHPFLDGNKRTGAMAALVFLDLNGVEFTATEDEFTAMVLAVASGQMEKPEIARFPQAHCATQG